MIRIEKQDTPHSLSLPSPKIRCPLAMPTPSIALPSLAIAQLLPSYCLVFVQLALPYSLVTISHVIYSTLSYIMLNRQTVAPKYIAYFIFYIYVLLSYYVFISYLFTSILYHTTLLAYIDSVLCSDISGLVHTKQMYSILLKKRLKKHIILIK